MSVRPHLLSTPPRQAEFVLLHETDGDGRQRRSNRLLVSQLEFIIFAAIGLATVCGLLAAMVFANLTAMPDAFSYVGNTPAAWLGDLHSKKAMKLSKAELLEDSAECIDRNSMVLHRAAKFIRYAMWVAWCSIGFGALSCVVALCCRIN
ncbi:hypothetical protein [Methylobacterium sp. WL1]|nr:hypothetical protein [Methylobacterium sp. WL1]TXN53430.1 hypothetical protein FV241_28160 [Methylobacterium sp. WL2]